MNVRSIEHTIFVHETGHVAPTSAHLFHQRVDAVECAHMEAHVLLMQCALIAKQTTRHNRHCEHVRISIGNVVQVVVRSIAPRRLDADRVVSLEHTSFAAHRGGALGLLVPSDQVQAEPVVVQGQQDAVEEGLEHRLVDDVGAGTPVVVPVLAPHPLQLMSVARVNKIELLYRIFVMRIILIELLDSSHSQFQTITTSFSLTSCILSIAPVQRSRYW